jgi:hypothetical protein
MAVVKALGRAEIGLRTSRTYAAYVRDVPKGGSDTYPRYIRSVLRYVVGRPPGTSGT